MDQAIGKGRAALLGGFVLTTLLLMGIGLAMVGSADGWNTPVVPLTASMNSAQGLRSGTRVRILGIVSGQVTAVEAPAKPGEPVIVRFWIRGDRASLVRANASARLFKDGLVGERVLEIDPGTAAEPPISPNTQITATEPPDWDALLAKVHKVVDQVEQGEGTLGQLVRDRKVYESVQNLVGHADQILASMDESYQSVRQNWTVGRWMQDHYQMLVRPEAHTRRFAFPETELFEPGKAVLTAAGKKRLDEAAVLIRKTDAENAEVLVAGFASDEPDSRLAELTSRKQAEAVLRYLVEQHSVQKTGWFAWRKTSSFGFGNAKPPNGMVDTSDSTASLAPRRVEILLFTP